MYMLVRDNVPAAMRKENQQCNYAKIENEEFYVFALKQKLVEYINLFLSSKEPIDISALVETQILINSFLELSVRKEEFEKMCADSLATAGGFSNRYVIFYDDNKNVSEKQ